ncbi:EthD family reductase [Pseudokineococcus marinus]|uniref:EthD family reductase n=1 Tax=Pseudokineococcus TaxID=1156392 RepID=UPI0030AEE81F
MAVKLTVIYDNPKDADAFEEHYAGTHAALAAKVPDVQKVETAKVFPKEDGSDTPAYRTADLYFVDYATACAALASPEGQALAADVDAVATGGYRMLLSQVGG